MAARLGDGWGWGQGERRRSGRRRRSSPLRWPCSPAATPARALPPRPAPVSPAASNYEPELAVRAAHLPPRATCWRGPCGAAASPARRSADKVLRRRKRRARPGRAAARAAGAVGAPDGVGLPDEVAVRRVAHVHRVAAHGRGQCGARTAEAGAAQVGAPGRAHTRRLAMSPSRPSSQDGRAMGSQTF